jgi:hypothetical protein
MDFLEGLKLRMLWDDFSQAEQISRIQQITFLCTEIYCTASFTSIGSL